MVVSGLMIHVYMGAVFPEEKPAFYSMITGVVNELYAYHHHFKWWREVKVQEQRWRQERTPQPEFEETVTGNEPDGNPETDGDPS
jgi:cytochrome b subunit of formate dehydrogenase